MTLENKQVSNQLCMTSERGVIYMKSVVVIYKSKYGSTKKYAKWLSELLSCDIFETKNINIEKVMKYDTIIL
ncbi:flavodoxin domain-containing protein, partial [Clostridioides difficile]|uniref:flavodoxin domain-containing protein n=1 Tax=Clostridioides difficile TaxID=1496 RepID=UPI002FE6CFF5